MFYQIWLFIIFPLPSPRGNDCFNCFIPDNGSVEHNYPHADQCAVADGVTV